MDTTLRRWMAVAFAILMASSLIAMPVVASTPDRTTDADWQRGSTVEGSTGDDPVLFGPPGGGPGGGGPPGGGGGPPGQGDGPPGHDRGDLGDPVDVPELAANTSIETMVDAVDRLEALAVDDEGATLVTETVDALNATALEYRSLQHADSRDAFSAMADAQERLEMLRAHVDENETATVDAVSADLYRASNASARLAVANALYVVAVNEDEFRNPGQRQKAESALGNARDALVRAEDSLTGGGPGNGNVGDEPVSPADRAQALTHLENAWKHADRALDTVEDNAEPSVSVSQRRAFEDNGTVLVPLTVTIQDVRAYEYERATIDVEGRSNPEPVNLSGAPGAGLSATGTTLIDVGPDAENATVTVRSTASHDAERTVETTHEIVVDEDAIVPDLPAPDEYTEVAVENESSGVRVDVVGEGLHESHIDVRDVTPETERPYRAGPMVRIENRTAFDEATVSIPVDEAALDREGNLSVVTWEPESDEPWTAVETEVDRDAGVLRADVEHFSFFSVFRIDDWEDETSATLNLSAEYDGNVTGPGNGSIEKIDVAFVIDESGSMGGSPLSYAKIAGKRFVGALTEDERAALVSFDSYASLRRGLTTDHDAVNASIDGLSAGGGTDTAAGLRTGLNHIEAEGWENRSSVMILLADGRSSSNSRAVAEDAAKAGVEISTIGLGNNIDEGELRMIAGETGGDFYHVQSPEDLPDAFDRVAENTTGVDLPDTDGDTIPDLVEEMNLSMPSGSSDVVGEPLNLDPYAQDTSGDGYLDNETVDVSYRVYEEDNATMLTASVTNAAHHPARVDTTGDGLTDRQQIEGWEIEVVDDHDTATEMEAAIFDEEDDREAASFFETRDVESDPLLTTTTENGLTDREEFELGTDPERRDTVGDGIPDIAALDDPREDPTVFKTSAPRLDWVEFDAGWTSGSGWRGVPIGGGERPGYEYEYEYRAWDHAGISATELKHSSTTKLEASYEPPEAVIRESTDFYAELGEGLTWLRGARSDIVLEDRWGNRGSEATVVKRSLGGSIASNAPGIATTEAGILSGFTHGVAEIPDFVRLLWNEPEMIAGGLATLATEYTETRLDPNEPESEFWMELARGAAVSIHETQEFDNPGEAPAADPRETLSICIEQSVDPTVSTSEYCSFAIGWYQGYALFAVVDVVIGTKGLTKISKGGSFAEKLSDAIDSSIRKPDAQWLGRVGGGSSKTNRLSRAVADGGSPELDAPDLHQRLRSDYGMESTGSIKAAIDHLEGVRHLESLTSSEHAALAAKISRSQDPSATKAFVNELDSADQVRHLLDEDVSSINRLVDWNAKPGQYRHIDPELDADDFLRIAQEGNPAETSLIVRRDGNDVVWLEQGTETYGKTHILKRHITGEMDDAPSDMFPVGGTVTREGESFNIPNRMTTAEVDDLIYEGLKYGTRDADDPARIVYSPSESQYGIETMRIIANEDSAIITAYPTRGDSVVTIPAGSK